MNSSSATRPYAPVAMSIERAEYERALAERRSEEVDLANRLVAASLKRQWNEALTRVDKVRAEAAKFRAQMTRVLTAEQRSRSSGFVIATPYLPLACNGLTKSPSSNSPASSA